MKESTQDLALFYESFADFFATGDAKKISSFIDQDTRNYSEKILLVYRNGYFKSSIDALKKTFEVTLKVLGNEVFSAIARAYVLQYPPRQGSLVRYGEQFPEFLLAQHSKLYIGALAKLDQAWINTLNARQVVGLTAERVTELNDQGYDIFDLNVALTDKGCLIELEFQVFELWEKIKYVEDITAINDVPHDTNSILLWQNDNKVNARMLLAEEAEFFNQIALKKTLGESATHVQNLYPNANIIELFSNLLENGLLIEEAPSGHIIKN